MRMTSQYELECVICGEVLKSSTKEFLCHECGTLIRAEWPAVEMPEETYQPFEPKSTRTVMVNYKYVGRVPPNPPQFDDDEQS